MKNADEMTPEELRRLADEKEFEEQYKVVKTGILKHDLYYIDEDPIKVSTNGVGVVTKERWDEILKNLLKTEPCLEKGDTFECYLEDGEEYWHDEDGYVEGESAEWAKEHLDVEEVKDE